MQWPPESFAIFSGKIKTVGTLLKCKTFNKFYIWLSLPVWPNAIKKFWWPLTTMMTFLQIGGSHNPACIHFKFNPPIPGQVCKLQGHQQPLSPLSMSKNNCHQKPENIVTIIVNGNALFIYIVPNITIIVSNYVVRVVVFTNGKSQHRSLKLKTGDNLWFSLFRLLKTLFLVRDHKFWWFVMNCF